MEASDVTTNEPVVILPARADAILSIELDYETVGDNMLMVAASGTAVKLG